MLKKKKELSSADGEEKNVKKKNSIAVKSACLRKKGNTSTEATDGEEKAAKGDHVKGKTQGGAAKQCTIVERKKSERGKEKRVAMSEVATSEVATSEAATSDVAASDVTTSEVAPSKVAASKVAPSKVAPSKVAPSKVAASKAAASKAAAQGGDEKINIKEAIIKNVKVPDNYEIKHLIGRGSYGYVYLAYDRSTKKNVAIKKVNRMFEDLIDCKRILREITILNRLKSNYIIRLRDLIIPEDLLQFDELYIVLEIADSDLKKLFKTPIYLTEEHVKTILYNLLLGEKYIHESGIIHRDLKPANCLLNQDCSVKICDFGLARTINCENDIHIVQDLEEKEENEEPGPHNKNLKKQLTSHVVTRWYRAPELILLQENYTNSIDIWSTGCIFAELLNMLESHVNNPTNRFPLFPGSSCFPLSPDHNSKKVHEKSNRDQLNIIFNVIGTPSEEDLKSIKKDDVIRYIKLFPPREGIDFKKKFPSISEEGIDLLQSMLRFNAKNRITIDSALSHPYLKDVRKTKLESFTASKIILPFDDWMMLSETQLRYIFLKEIQSFHPELVIPPKLSVHEGTFYNDV
ncbi:mitogen-activated protein kinase 2, putative [Plasmodium vivax]|uniref:Mitogen-activated protein kinase n=1 Tax=Plasmodium vivax (strain Salvador I) TaxID=126793 RepID=A5K4F4_PLAVS|nr:mitogen-activated protein kinase 2, putative [Plasmodium vivax]EDL45532.1 mitogen-activated protein kinase 2, putative [Plasmodium vivax]|eukprot:XP_001615259.1 mitogen-activated protein kinase 2 [Plasmodium vivax Sal-1]